jgi:hypothetical protein
MEQMMECLLAEIKANQEQMRAKMKTGRNESPSRRDESHLTG